MEVVARLLIDEVKDQAGAFGIPKAPPRRNFASEYDRALAMAGTGDVYPMRGNADPLHRFGT